jgi:hypothetical protein
MAGKQASRSTAPLARAVMWAAMGAAALTVCAIALELWLLADFERLTQQNETALRSPATDAQALRSLAASALDAAQGMTQVATAALLLAIGIGLLCTALLFLVYRKLKQREDRGDHGMDAKAHRH